MADLLESADVHVLSPAIFGGRFRHPCYAGCGQVMVVPDPRTARERLGDGEIWGCGQCGALHEYYLAYGSASRNALVRVLRGVHRRTAGEPTVQEFVGE